MRRMGHGRRESRGLLRRRIPFVLATAVAVGACMRGTDSSADARSAPEIATVRYERSAGPLGDATEGERAQTDPHRITELADLLERYDTLDTPARPVPTVMCVWATITTVRYVTVAGDAHELLASSCDPTPFEADLGALVADWMATPG